MVCLGAGHVIQCRNARLCQFDIRIDGRLRELLAEPTARSSLGIN